MLKLHLDGKSFCPQLLLLLKPLNHGYRLDITVQGYFKYIVPLMDIIKGWPTGKIKVKRLSLENLDDEE